MASTVSAMHTGFTKINGSPGNWIIKQPYLWMHKYGYSVSQYFFFFLSEVIIIPWVSAVPFIIGRREVSEGFWNAQDLSLILVEWRTAFCLSSGSLRGLCSLRRRGVGLGGRGTAELRMSVPGGCQVASRRQTTNPYRGPGIVRGAFYVLCSINQIATRNGSFSKTDVPATKGQFVYTQD